MISRRGLFKMLGAVAASPALKPFAKLVPETAYTTYLIPDGWVSYRVTYSMSPRPDSNIGLRKILPGERYFPCGTGEMGKFYWSKERS